MATKKKTSKKAEPDYGKLWKEADAYAMDNLKDDELSYFLETTD